MSFNNWERKGNFKHIYIPYQKTTMNTMPYTHLFLHIIYTGQTLCTTLVPLTCEWYSAE